MHRSKISKFALVLSALLSLPSTGDTPGGQLNTSTRTLVILGASYAKGWGEPMLPGFGRVINRGIGGDETGDMLKRFDKDVVAVRPDAVLIWGHVNDITRSSPDAVESKKSAARKNYIEMLERARASRIQVILATEIPWTEPSGILNSVRAWIGGLRGKQSYAARISGHVGELNEFLKLRAADEKIILLDFERSFANEAGTRNPQFAAEDRSHISPAGYAALTAYSRRELARQLR
jgi:lysophospholipase L1-like esterase